MDDGNSGPARRVAPRGVLIVIGLAVVALLALSVVLGRRALRRPRTPEPAPALRARMPRVVSLAPAASDIIEGIGAGDHLVAVSNYDTDPRTAKLPRVGDYLNTDWERIAPLHPGVIVTQFIEGRTPAGFVDRARQIGARQVNIHIDVLDDIYAAVATLGDACGEQAQGAAAAQRLRKHIEAIHRKVAGEPAVPALIVIGPEATGVAGTRTYLDDLLTAAGGRNVIEAAGYPTIDHERLAKLAPQVIIQLLAAPAPPQVQRQAEATWAAMPDVPAVRNGRVARLSEWYVMEPGYEVGTLAEQFARILHPHATLPLTTTPASEPSTNPRLSDGARAGCS
jgi:iron complex transport system substrate-binding protein